MRALAYRIVLAFLCYFCLPSSAFGTISASITVTSVTPSPAVLGNSVTINYSVTNTGNVANNFGVGCEIWQGSTFKASVGTQMTGSVSAGGNRTGSFPYTIPLGWSAGTYIARCAVWSGTPGSSTWLNSSDLSFTVQARVVNADITTTSVVPSPVVAGNSVTINYSVTNTGNVANNFGVGCEIWQGSTFKASVGTQNTGSVSPNSSHTGSFPYTIPSGWSAGTYTARCVAWSGTPGSSTWLDNSDLNFTVQARVINADITTTSVVPSPVIAGNSVTINYSLTNTGNVTNNFGVGCEIWQGSTLKASVGTQMTGSVASGSNHTGSFPYTIPSGWSAGTHTARCVVWSGTPGSSTWLDSSDLNFTVQAQVINADITTISVVPSPVIAGNSVTINYSVLNTGNVSNDFGVGCEIWQGSTLRVSSTFAHFEVVLSLR